MGSACGVSWSGTSSGKLEESGIPDPPDHKSHYLNAAETKGDSSFPVVDGSGNLRSGNVSSAWDLRGSGEGVSESCLKKLDNAFDGNVLPDSAYENSIVIGEEHTQQFGMNVEFSAPPQEALAEGFNRFGVRENDDGSLDVRFDAMEPGERKGFQITPEFLRRVTGHEYDTIPLQLDHSKSQRANVGYIEPDGLRYDDTLRVQAHIPNTGSSFRDDIIADFTHEPPQITDISVSFDPRTVEVDPARGRDEAPEFVDARIREFSLTPFPSGYDNGGLTPEFSAAVEKAGLDVEDEETEFDEPQSKLIQRPHYLIIK